MDTYISYQLNQFVHHWQILDFAIFFTAEWLPYLAIILFFWLFIKKMHFNKNAATIVFFAFIAALISRFVIAEIFYYFLERPRPFATEQNIINLLNHSLTDSFPSGHAAFFFTLPAMLYLYDKKLGAKLMVLIILMGIARITAGVHWLSDILAGAIIGIITTLLIYRLFLSKKRINFNLK